ncbi:MAG: hypothetical protein VXY74_04935, partial [SAR324 cluster bacterium]|nr:hypothetical protein [SAR324 cluster bacterium]
MQATEQTTTPNTEKEWEILNQLAEIAADIENQTSYYSFQSEDGNPVFDTLLVDVKSWISQLQSLVLNTISHDDVPVVLPNLTATTSSSVLQQESAEVFAEDDKVIDNETNSDTAGEENGADSSTYLGAVAEAVAQELQGNSTAGFENADAIDSEQADEENSESTNPVDEDDAELVSINEAIEQAEQIEAQSVHRVQLNSEPGNERETTLDEVEEDIEEEEAESWFQEELAEEEEALSIKDSAAEEIQPDSLLLKESAEPPQVAKSDDEELGEDNLEGSETKLGISEAKENICKVEDEDATSDLGDSTNESAEAQPVAPEELIEGDKLVLSRMPDDATPADEPIIDDDSESHEASESSENLVTEDANEPLEVLTPSEVELLASEASHGGVVDEEEESEGEEDLVVELDLDSEEDLAEENPENLATEDNHEIVNQAVPDADHPNQSTSEHEELNQDFTPDSESAEIDNTTLEGETPDSPEFDSKLNSDEVNDESSEIDELQEISVEEDEVEEERELQQLENPEIELAEETSIEEARKSPDTETPQIMDSGEMGENLNPEESSEHFENNAESFSTEEKQQYKEALEVNLEQEISPETKDLRELESLESTDATMVSTENVSESFTDGAG